MSIQYFPPTFIPISDNESVPLSRVYSLQIDRKEKVYILGIDYYGTQQMHTIPFRSKAGREIASIITPQDELPTVFTGAGKAK